MGVIDMVKDVISIAQKADNFDLIKQMLEIQTELQSLQMQNFNLVKEISQLKEQLDRKSTMEYDYLSNIYIVRNEYGTTHGRYCPRCWEKDGKQSRLYYYDKDLRCNVCDTIIEDILGPTKIFYED